jgi:hypothetical protein
MPHAGYANPIMNDGPSFPLEHIITHAIEVSHALAGHPSRSNDLGRCQEMGHSYFTCFPSN